MLTYGELSIQARVDADRLHGYSSLVTPVLMETELPWRLARAGQFTIGVLEQLSEVKQKGPKQASGQDASGSMILIVNVDV
jgi:hypothetical protein